MSWAGNGGILDFAMLRYVDVHLNATEGVMDRFKLKVPLVRDAA